MPTFIRLNMPKYYHEGKQIAVNINQIRSISPRMIICPEDVAKHISLQDKRWIEDGTWITTGDGEEGTFHVAEDFETVMPYIPEA